MSLTNVDAMWTIPEESKVWNDRSVIGLVHLLHQKSRANPNNKGKKGLRNNPLPRPEEMNAGSHNELSARSLNHVKKWFRQKPKLIENERIWIVKKLEGKKVAQKERLGKSLLIFDLTSCPSLEMDSERFRLTIISYFLHAPKLLRGLKRIAD